MKNVLNIICTSLFIIILGGCDKVKPPSDVIPPQLEMYKKSISSSTICKEPIVPKVKFSKDFKYGCFCGLNHPSLGKPKNSSKSLTPEETKNLISSYYKIQPYDDIDRACQSHDICYLYKGKAHKSCNAAFRNRLQEISDYMHDKRGFLNSDSKEWRCGIVSIDMKLIFGTFFTDEKSEDKYEETSSFVGRLFSTPFLVTIAAIFRPIVWYGPTPPYPLNGEKCNISSIPPPTSANKSSNPTVLYAAPFHSAQYKTAG